MGLSAACDCGISWSYSLSIFESNYDYSSNIFSINYNYIKCILAKSCLRFYIITLRIVFNYRQLQLLITITPGLTTLISSCWLGIIHTGDFTPETMFNIPHFALGCLACCVFLGFRHFPIWCYGSGMVLDCIDSWSLPSYSLYKLNSNMNWFLPFITFSWGSLLLSCI